MNKSETVNNLESAGEFTALWLRNYKFVWRNGSRQRKPPEKSSSTPARKPTKIGERQAAVPVRSSANDYSSTPSDGYPPSLSVALRHSSEMDAKPFIILIHHQLGIPRQWRKRAWAGTSDA